MYGVAVSTVVEKLLKRLPLTPFELVLAEGRILRVTIAEQAWLDFDDELLYIVRLKPADEPLTEIVSTKHIALVRLPERLTPGQI